MISKVPVSFAEATMILIPRDTEAPMVTTRDMVEVSAAMAVAAFFTISKSSPNQMESLTVSRPM